MKIPKLVTSGIKRPAAFPPLGMNLQKCYGAIVDDEQVALREAFRARWASTKHSQQEVVGDRVWRVPSVGFKLGLLRNSDNSLWLSERREVNGDKYWGGAMGVRQPLWRMHRLKVAHLVPGHTPRQPGKDQEERERWLIRLEPLGCGETCGKGDRLVQSSVGLGLGNILVRTCPRPPACREEVGRASYGIPELQTLALTGD